MLTMIDARATIDGSGDVSSLSSNLITSVDHVGTGIYKFNLSEPLNAFIGLNVIMLPPNGSVSGVVTIEGLTDAPTEISNAAAPSVSIQCLDAAGSPVDPSNTSVICFMLYGRNSSISR
jgi:hypothetical protein